MEFIGERIDAQTIELSTGGHVFTQTETYCAVHDKTARTGLATDERSMFCTMCTNTIARRSPSGHHWQMLGNTQTVYDVHNGY